MLTHLGWGVGVGVIRLFNGDAIMTDITIRRDTIVVDAEAFAKSSEGLQDVRSVDEIKTYIQNQVTDLASARVVLVKMAISIQSLSLQVAVLKRRLGSL